MEFLYKDHLHRFRSDHYFHGANRRCRNRPAGETMQAWIPTKLLEADKLSETGLGPVRGSERGKKGYQTRTMIRYLHRGPSKLPQARSQEPIKARRSPAHSGTLVEPRIEREINCSEGAGRRYQAYPLGRTREGASSKAPDQ